MRSTVAGFVAAAFLFAGAPALAKEATQKFAGEITHIDTMAKTLVVTMKGKPDKEMTFSLAPDAKIMAGPKARSLEELKTGERVKVSYADEGSKHQAQRIDVMHAKLATAKPVRPYPHPSSGTSQ